VTSIKQDINYKKIVKTGNWFSLRPIFRRKT
jgi:hypothetical protein